MRQGSACAPPSCRHYRGLATFHMGTPAPARRHNGKALTDPVGRPIKRPMPSAHRQSRGRILAPEGWSPNTSLQAEPKRVRRRKSCADRRLLLTLPCRAVCTHLRALRDRHALAEPRWRAAHAVVADGHRPNRPNLPPLHLTHRAPRAQPPGGKDSDGNAERLRVIRNVSSVVMSPTRRRIWGEN